MLSLANRTHRGLAVFGGEPGVPEAYDRAGDYLGGSADRAWGDGVTTPRGPVVFGAGSASVFSTAAKVSHAAPGEGSGVDLTALADHVRHIDSVREGLSVRRAHLVRHALGLEVGHAVLDIAETQLYEHIPSSLASFLG
jgi:hypothetical protein